ncbi:MAG: hypothetical protein ACTHME_04865 [Candidatus Nitrosocosmicus sp.]
MILIYNIVVILLLSRKEKENRVIHLAHEGKTRTEIANASAYLTETLKHHSQKEGDDNNETKK